MCFVLYMISDLARKVYFTFIIAFFGREHIKRCYPTLKRTVSAEKTTSRSFCNVDFCRANYSTFLRIIN